MLGPDCVLVHRTSRDGYRALDRNNASTLQKYLLGDTGDDDWLLRQCQRIAVALNDGELALAQIYGLRIPIGQLDDSHLRSLTTYTKAGFNPDEPRVPKGDPRGGEWATDGNGGR